MSSDPHVGPAKRLRLFIAGVLWACAALAHASTQPLIEPGRVTLTIRGAEQMPSAAAMRRIVLAAAAVHGWQAVAEQPGLLTLRVSSGGHSATVDVAYDAGGFQIAYRDSAQMEYEVEGARAVIHPRYNKWISEFSNEIRRAARDPVQQRPTRGDIDPEAEAPSAATAR